MIFHIFFLQCNGHDPGSQTGLGTVRTGRAEGLKVTQIDIHPRAWTSTCAGSAGISSDTPL